MTVCVSGIGLSVDPRFLRSAAEVVATAHAAVMIRNEKIRKLVHCGWSTM
jgi:hypothetical protein